ncbi:MAG: hypothetical protein JO270_12105 [Acidobacteriaceae bacterium]|nr:hypothetical protein [Acidobacteriaceae bacterium]
MKLRFRGNGVRLRLNRREVESLAAGCALEEQVVFPGEQRFAYTLQSGPAAEAGVSFEGGRLQVLAPQRQITEWADGTDIGLYFAFPANGSILRVAIEKDLECVDGPAEERDPDAFPRSVKGC